MSPRGSAPPTRKKNKPTRAEVRKKLLAYKRKVLAKLRRTGEVLFTQDFRRYRVVQATPIEDGLVLALVRKRLTITPKAGKSDGQGSYAVADGEGGWTSVPREHLFGVVVEEQLRMPPRSRRVITIRDVFLETPSHFEIWLPTRKGDRRCVYRRLVTAIEKIRAAGFGGYQLGKRIVWFAKKTTPKRRKVGRRRGSRLAAREAALVSP